MKTMLFLKFKQSKNHLAMQTSHGARGCVLIKTWYERIRILSEGFRILIVFFIIQKDGMTQGYDLLNTNTSAAFTLMGYSPTEIATPSDLKEFNAALNNSTENLTKLPKNLAMEIPFSKNLVKSDRFSWKRLSMSLGFVSTTAENSIPGMSRLGLGFRLPICPGKISTMQQEKFAENWPKKYITVDEYSKADSRRKFLKCLIDKNQLDQKNDENNKDFDLQYLAYAKEDELLDEQLNKAIKISRINCFLDLQAGTVLDFPTNVGSYSKFYKSGIWLVSGATDKSEKFTFLVAAKLLFSHNIPNLTSNKITTLLPQLGGRINYRAGKGNFSAEYSAQAPTIAGKKVYQDKLAINASIEFSNNSSLTLAFGKDFDNVIAKEGNIFSLLNFIKGFGGK